MPYASAAAGTGTGAFSTGRAVIDAVATAGDGRVTEGAGTGPSAVDTGAAFGMGLTSGCTAFGTGCTAFGAGTAFGVGTILDAGTDLDAGSVFTIAGVGMRGRDGTGRPPLSSARNHSRSYREGAALT